MTATRTALITAKINSRYGNHFLHVEHSAGRITGLSISSPGKFSDSEIGDLLRSIGEAATAIIADIGTRQ